MLLLMKSWLMQQQTGKSAKNKTAQTSADAPQPSQAKRKGPKSTKSQPKRQRTAPSSPPRPVSPIHVESSPSSPEAQTQEVPSPPRHVLQQEAPANVSEQVADPADLGTSSATLPEQKITIPPQGKVSIIELSPMNFILANYNHPCNFLVQVIPSATLADQPTVPAASPRHRREIALKQVSYLISTFYQHLIIG